MINRVARHTAFIGFFWMVALLTASAGCAFADELYLSGHTGGHDDCFGLECVASFGEAIENFAFQGRYAYLAEGYTLRVLDLADPVHPREVGHLRVAGRIATLDVKGPALYLATDHPGHGLKIVDISDPAHPRLHATEKFNSLHLISRRMGEFLMVADVGKWSEGYRVYRLADPLHPTLVGRGGTRIFECNPFFTDGSRFFQVILPEARGPATPPFLVMDLTTSPTTLGRLPAAHFSGYDLPVALQYREGRLVVGDAHTTLTLPLGGDLKQHWRLTPHLTATASSGSWRLEETPPDNGDVGYRLTNAAQPGRTLLEIMSNNWDARSVVLAGPALYSIESGKIKIYDLTGATPVERGAFPEDETYHSPIQVVGDAAMVQTGHGLSLFDLSNPFTPVRKGRYNPIDGIAQARAADGRAYLVDQDRGVIVMDVSDPAAPRVLARHPQTTETLIGAIEGNRLILTHGDAELEVMDFTDPARPALRGRYCEQADAFSLSGDRLYVAQGRTVRILDLSTPGTLQPLGEFRTEEHCSDLASSGTMLYVLARNVVHLVDTADPARPKLLGRAAVDVDNDWTEPPGWGLHLKHLGNALYVIRVERSSGHVTCQFVVVDITHPAAPRVLPHLLATRGEDEPTTISAWRPASSTAPFPGWMLCLPTGYRTTGRSGHGVMVFDVSDPLHPVAAGTYARFRSGTGIVLAKEPLCLADEDGGMMILRPVR